MQSPSNHSPLLSPSNDPWLRRFAACVQAELANSALDNQLLAIRMRISARSLHRKLRERLGLSPAQYVRQVRLQRAAELLQKGDYLTVKETAAAVGYQNSSYFIEQYAATFGHTPMSALRDAGHR